MSRKNPEEKKAYDRSYFKRYYLENRERILAKNRQWSIDNKEKIDERRRRKQYWKKQTPEQRRAYHREYARKLKVEVLTHYGGGKLACIRCGFSDIRALSIDHIGNNGAEHRKQVGRLIIYNWLKNHNYPEGYQTLCMNCQWVKRFEAHS